MSKPSLLPMIGLCAAGLIAAPAAAQDYTIPVVVHVLWNTPWINIPDALVQSGIDNLNDVFNASSLDEVDPPYDTLAANMGIGFCLASLDPDGQPTTGIDRIQTTLALQGRTPESYINQWPPDRYLNIWIIENFGQTGPGSYRPDQAEEFPERDGIMTLYVDLQHGIPGSRIFALHAGRYFNLKLLWEDPVEGFCGDDEVDDTPPSKLSFDCSPTPDGCAGEQPAMMENYMTYTSCTRMFTQGQKERVIDALHSSVAGRNNLWSPENLALTGCLTTGIRQAVHPTTLAALPLHDALWNIQLPENTAWNLGLFNMAGQPLQHWAGATKELNIDLGDQPAGLYLLQAMDPQGRTATAKLLRF